MSLRFVNFLIILFALWCYLTPVFAQSVGFEWQNDFMVPFQQDRFLTNALKVWYRNLALGTEMYTPTKKRNPEIPWGDRPWAGYSYLEYKKHLGRWEDERIWIARAGLMGNASGAKALQKFVHNDLGMGSDPLGWDTQNPSEPVLELEYNHAYRTHLTTWIGDAEYSVLYGIRGGNFKNQLFLEQEIKRGIFERKFSLYIFAQMHGRAVLHDATLRGSLFQDNTYTIKHIPFVAHAGGGIGVSYKKWGLRYHYRYLTEEFRGQVGRHSYGTLEVSHNF